MTDKSANADVAKKPIRSSLVEALGIVSEEVIKAKRSQIFWDRVKIFSVVVMLGLSMITTAYEQYNSKSKNSVAVVDIAGVIGEGNGSADKIIPILKAAFEKKDAKAVILSINSPGGAPTDADRIGQMIDELKAETKKPVIAIVDGVGASAAYMIAIRADKIIASKYSIIGSIGVIIKSWDYHEIMEKVGIKQNVYASGKLKSMLNPYTAMTADADKKAQEIVDRMAVQFANDVRTSRGEKLKHTDFSTGEVWPGEESLELGLIDEIGTIELYVKKNFDDASLVRIKAKSGFNMFGMNIDFQGFSLQRLVSEFVGLSH